MPTTSNLIILFPFEILGCYGLLTALLLLRDKMAERRSRLCLDSLVLRKAHAGLRDGLRRARLYEIVALAELRLNLHSVV